MAISSVVERPAETTAVSDDVVSMVAAKKSIDPVDLDPLYRTIDPDALDALYERDGLGRPSSPERVEFTYSGCEVVVDSDGSVTVTETPLEGSG